MLIIAQFEYLECYLYAENDFINNKSSECKSLSSPLTENEFVFCFK